MCLRSSRSSTGSAGAVSGQKQSLGQNHGQNSNPDSDAGSSCRDSDRASNGYSNHSDNNSEAGNSGASSDRNGARGVNRVADSAARPDQGLSIAYQHYEDRLGISEVNSPVEDSEGPQYDRNSDLLVSDSPGADYQQNSKPPTYSRKSSAQSLLSPDVSPIHQKKSFHVIDDMEEMGTEMHRNELMETVNNNYDSYSYTGNSKPHSYSNIDNSSRKYTLYSHQSDADEAEENVTDKAINTFNKYSRSGDYANNKYTSNGSAKAVRYENSDYQLVTEDTLLDRIKRSYFQVISAE